MDPRAAGRCPGAAPLVWFCLRAVRHPNPRRRPAEVEEPVRLFTEEG